MSGFGEISEPSSRTAWEDWDDVVLKETFPELRLHKKLEIPAVIETFIILEGRYFYDCVKAQQCLELVNSIPEVNLHLYKTKTINNLICVIKDYNLIQSSEILELLKDYVTKSIDVVGVLTKPLVEYQAAQLVTNDFIIRRLNTSNELSRNLNSSYLNLEQPNIIAGVAAGALCYREIIDKPAVVLVCYIEHPEDQLIPDLQELLEKYKIIPHAEKVNQTSLLSSNLYI